jgi:hypothetical protein
MGTSMNRWTQVFLLSATSLTLVNSQIARSELNQVNPLKIPNSFAPTPPNPTCKKPALPSVLSFGGGGIPPLNTTLTESGAQDFLVFGGGGAPSYNEIALEKNILYFQRSLKELGYGPASVPIYFANGTTKEKTVRFYDETQIERFKAPEIPSLGGSSSILNLGRSIEQLGKKNVPTFFYFTGHGGHNRRNADNASLLMWRDQALTVQGFTEMLDRLPRKMPFITMMAQCYSGSFANMIYRGGDPKRGVALHTRCGFFATIKTQPSVGCTAEVNEADYRDYSSSFFAGLTGRDRTGRRVASADYNRDGRVSYREAHAFAKVDEYTTDLPISTSEAWLQRKVENATQRNQLLAEPIAPLVDAARPDQQYVIKTLSEQFQFDLRRSFLENIRVVNPRKVKSSADEAYLTRLSMELLNVAIEQRVKASKNPQDMAILTRLINCESGSWGKSWISARSRKNNALRTASAKAKQKTRVKPKQVKQIKRMG